MTKADNLAAGEAVLGWLAAGAAVLALGAVVWNLPQGKHTEVVAIGEGDQVAIGREGPGFDAEAEANARTIDDLKKVYGPHLAEGNK